MYTGVKKDQANPPTQPQILGIDFHLTVPGANIKWRLYVLPVSSLVITFQASWRSYLIKYALTSGAHSFHQSTRAWVWQPIEQRPILCFHSSPVFCVLFVTVYLGTAMQPCSCSLIIASVTPSLRTFNLSH